MVLQCSGCQVWAATFIPWSLHQSTEQRCLPAHHPSTSAPPGHPSLSPHRLHHPTPENTLVSNSARVRGSRGFVCGEGALASAERSSASTFHGPFFTLAFSFYPLQRFSALGAFSSVHPSLLPHVCGCRSSGRFRCGGSELLGRQKGCDGWKG